MADPLTLLSLLGSSGGEGSAPSPTQIASQLPSILYRGITGLKQRRDAREALRQLEGKEPAIETPAAIRQRALEPISETVMQAQSDEQARRTAESVGALQKAGARGIIGGLPRVLDAERASERNRMAGYEQERKRALSEFGQAEMNTQNRRMQNYLSKVAAATRALEAGQQNIMGSLDTIAGFGQQSYGADLMQGEGYDYSYALKRLKGVDPVNINPIPTSSLKIE